MSALPNASLFPLPPLRERSERTLPPFPADRHTHGIKKANLENLIGFADDVSTLAKSLTALVPTAEKTAKQSAIKALTNINNITEVSTEVSKIGKGLSFASLKVLVSLGVVGVIVHSINETNKLEGTNNKDMIIAVKTKTAIYLALLFTPAWIALGATILTELVWAFIKDAIYNSKIEQYLYQSLLFNTPEHNKYRTFNEQKGLGYKASIMINTFKASGINLKIEHFKSINDIQEFIANYYTQYHDIFDMAMRNELTQLNAIAYDLTLSISEGKTPIEDESEHHIVAHAYTHVKLPSSARKHFKALVHLHNGKPIEKQRHLEMHEDGNIYYNTLQEPTVRSFQNLLNTNNEELIIATDDMALKYKVIYETQSSPMGNTSSNENIQIENLEITRLDLIPMSAQDDKYIKEAQ